MLELRQQADLFGPPPVMDRPWIFAPLERRAYSLIMIDPPWKTINWSDKDLTKAADAHYGCMSLADIKALPVAELAAKDCLLWLWTTTPFLELAFDVMRAWGFTYSTELSWVKTTTRGKVAFGTGRVLRNAHEPVIIARRGKPKIMSKSVRSTLHALRREHSRKPDDAYTVARKLIPYGRAADVFSREAREGWENWGDEATKFNEATP
jgi:N6-adenosine-specific RNA methylase IME4